MKKILAKKLNYGDTIGVVGVSNSLKLNNRYEDLKKAATKLNEALNGEVSGLEIDGTLHRFEFTFELVWKTMKDCLFVS